VITATCTIRVIEQSITSVMSLRAEEVKREASNFSLADYLNGSNNKNTVQLKPSVQTSNRSTTPSTEDGLKFRLDFKNATFVNNTPSLKHDPMFKKDQRNDDLMRYAILLDNSRSKLIDCQQKLEMAEASVIRLNNKLSTEKISAKTQISQITRELTIAQQNEKSARGELNKIPMITNNAEDVQKLRNRAKIAIDLEKEHQKLKLNLASLETKSADVTDQLDKLRLEHESLQSTHSDVLKELSTAQSLISEPSANELVQLRVEYDSLSITHKSVLKEFEELKVQLATTDISSHESGHPYLSMHDHNNAISDIKTTLEMAHTKELQQARDEAASAKEVRETAEELLHDTTARIQELESLHNSTIMENKELQQTMDNMKAESEETERLFVDELPPEVTQLVDKYNVMSSIAIKLARLAYEKPDNQHLLIESKIKTKHAADFFQSLATGMPCRDIEITRDCHVSNVADSMIEKCTSIKEHLNDVQYKTVCSPLVSSLRTIDFDYSAAELATSGAVNASKPRDMTRLYVNALKKDLKKNLTNVQSQIS